MNGKHNKSTLTSHCHILNCRGCDPSDRVRASTVIIPTIVWVTVLCDIQEWSP